jgi:hypothetical protein
MLNTPDPDAVNDSLGVNLTTSKAEESNGEDLLGRVLHLQFGVRTIRGGG